MHTVQGRQIVPGQFLGIIALGFSFLLCVSSSCRNQRGVLRSTLQDRRKGVPHYVLALYWYVATNTPPSCTFSLARRVSQRAHLASELFRFRRPICARPSGGSYGWLSNEGRLLLKVNANLVWLRLKGGRGVLGKMLGNIAL